MIDGKVVESKFNKRNSFANHLARQGFNSPAVLINEDKGDINATNQSTDQVLADKESDKERVDD